MRRLAPLVLILALAAPALAQPPPLLPRTLLFGNPERTMARISPDGKWLAWLAPDKRDVLQVWIERVGNDDTKMITADRVRGIRSYQFAEDDRTLLYTQDLDGDENWHVYGVDLVDGTVRDLTPFQGVQGRIVATSLEHPHELLIGMNIRNRALHDVYRCDLRTGAITMDTENPGDVSDWTVDAHMVVRGARIIGPDGGVELRVRDRASAPWRTLVKASQEEILFVAGFTPDGKGLYLESSLGSDTARFVERDLKSGRDKVLAARPDVDVDNALIDRYTHRAVAVTFDPGRVEWQPLDPSLKADFAALAAVDGDLGILGRDRADRTWLVAYERDRGPLRYYTYDRATKKTQLLFSRMPALEHAVLSEMKSYTIAARDGLKLPIYVTLPAGYAARNLPTVIDVHGGPWARDHWGFDPEVQWLANRGYAVVQVNFRASTGFGKKFLHAGDKQWGKAMLDDLLDAAEWAKHEGFADPKRIAIYGASYGGYAALAGAAFSPDAFRCAVDIVGPSNLFTLMKTFPPYWRPQIARFVTRMGDPDKEPELVRAASPLFSADKIHIPMLIGQGANDPRVNRNESEQIVAALAKNGAHAVYVLYADEGHGFARPANRIDFNARAEKFLGAELGGRVEPLPGDKVPGATPTVREVGYGYDGRKRN